VLNLFADWLNKAATNKAIQGSDLRVLMILLSSADEYANSEISQVEIARRLDIKSQNVTKSITALENQGIIKRLKINRKTYGFKLKISPEEN